MIFTFNIFPGGYRKDYSAEDFYEDYYTGFAVIIIILVLFWLYWKYWDDFIDWRRRLSGTNTGLQANNPLKEAVWCVGCRKYGSFTHLRDYENMDKQFSVSRCNACGNELIRELE